MENYTVFSMIQPNGQLKVLAISDDTEADIPDFFVCGSTGLETIGTLEIDGTATHYLNESFSL